MTGQLSIQLCPADTTCVLGKRAQQALCIGSLPLSSTAPIHVHQQQPLDWQHRSYDAANSAIQKHSLLGCRALGACLAIMDLLWWLPYILPNLVYMPFLKFASDMRFMPLSCFGVSSNFAFTRCSHGTGFAWKRCSVIGALDSQGCASSRLCNANRSTYTFHTTRCTNMIMILYAQSVTPSCRSSSLSGAR
jgi:hypothetical protein